METHSDMYAGPVVLLPSVQRPARAFRVQVSKWAADGYPPASEFRARGEASERGWGVREAAADIECQMERNGNGRPLVSNQSHIFWGIYYYTSESVELLFAGCHTRRCPTYFTKMETQSPNCVKVSKDVLGDCTENGKRKFPMACVCCVCWRALLLA